MIKGAFLLCAGAVIGFTVGATLMGEAKATQSLAKKIVEMERSKAVEEVIS